MPPFIPQKRHRSSSPSVTKQTAKSAATSRTLEDNQRFLNTLEQSDGDSSLSEVDSDDFEDAFPPSNSKRQRLSAEDEEEDPVDWEDAIKSAQHLSPNLASSRPSKDLEITIEKNAKSHPMTNRLEHKKGPTKIERQVRLAIHSMHVQCLLFHKLVRNGWACDTETQQVLVDQMPPTLKREVDKLRSACGLGIEDAKTQHQPMSRSKGAPKGRKAKQKRSQRDWSKPAQVDPASPNNPPDSSRGDPLVRLLKILAVYWKKRYCITNPCLRKQGYKPPYVLEQELASWKENPKDAEAHGERIVSQNDFKQFAHSCEGSMDVGVQLFVCLLRGLGLDVRLVASLQPLGYGWTQGEEGIVKGQSKQEGFPTETDTEQAISADEIEAPSRHIHRKRRKPRNNREPISKRTHRGAKNAPIDVDGDSSPIDEDGKSDDDSVVDITPEVPRRRPNKHYDRDLPSPTSWAEVISPVTNLIYPVDPFVLTPAVATTPEHIGQFESRGSKADKAKQIFGGLLAPFLTFSAQTCYHSTNGGCFFETCSGEYG